MANPEVYSVENHYLVRADYRDRDSEEITTRDWDVYIASKDEVYFGKAELKDDKGLKYKAVIPWVELKNKELSPLNELISIMKKAFE